MEIPKREKGKARKLGIPTAADRVVRQAIAGVPSPIYEPMFHEPGYGFRPGRGAHDALRACQRAYDEGYVRVVGMDLERLSDNVSHPKPIQPPSDTIRDGRAVSLIHRFLKAGVMEGGVLRATEAGAPQGGPLPPLLSSIMLNGLGWELDRRGRRFVRYADGCMMLRRPRKAAERTLGSIVRCIGGKLLLKANREKASAARLAQAKLLGCGFGGTRGKRWLRLRPKSLAAMRGKVGKPTARSSAIPNAERPALPASSIRGRVGCCRLCSMKVRMQEAGQWMRRLGFGHGRALMCAGTRKGCWRAAGSFMQVALPGARLASMGCIPFSGCHAAMHAG